MKNRVNRATHPKKAETMSNDEMERDEEIRKLAKQLTPDELRDVAEGLDRRSELLRHYAHSVELCGIQIVLHRRRA